MEAQEKLVFTWKMCNIRYYEEIAYEYDVSLIHLSSPGSLSMIECKNNDEFKILKKMYVHPLNCLMHSWNFHAKSEFHMANWGFKIIPN